MFNNVIQYQFDGNSNLVYTIIRKRQVFHALANLPTDCGAINKTLTRRGKKTSLSRSSSVASSPIGTEQTLPNVQGDGPLEAGNRPATMAEPGTYKASLMEMPHIGEYHSLNELKIDRHWLRLIDKLTEKASAHPSQQQLDRLTNAGPSATLFSTGVAATQQQDPENASANV